jgi:hypothetical protein
MRRTTRQARAVRRTLHSHAIAGAMRDPRTLRNAHGRAQIAARAAMAGWHDDGHGRRHRGWWRHRNGGYGWVGPLFWPFAYYDIYDYALWGPVYDDTFWDYGYGDIYAGLFAPYGYDELSGYLPAPAISGVPVQRSSSGQTPPPPTNELAQMCGNDSRMIAGFPIDRIQQAVQPTPEQQHALDDLANASVKAAQDIKAACPTTIALTAPDRLVAMQQRIEAMIAAVKTVQPALEKFYGLLNDEQKARFNAISEAQHPRKEAEARHGGSNTPAATCGGTAGLTEWPASAIDRMVHPTEAQRPSLDALRDASARAADLLRTSCRPDDALTPPARLAAVGKRLDVMLDAIKTVRSALDNFYGKLTDEQKAQFEAIGQRRAGLSDRSETMPHHGHRRHHHRASVDGIIRHLMSFAR